MFIIKNFRIFISYASVNKNKADEICEYLEAQGKKCWIAPRDIPAGFEYGEEIIKGIEKSDAFVLVFSKASNESQHVLREVERAVNRKLPIISYRIEYSELSKSMEYFLSSNQWLDATTESMLPTLNEALNKLFSDKKNAQSVGSSPEYKVSVSNKAVPIMLGVIAVALISIAAVIAYKLNGDDNTPESTETSLTSVSTTAALTTTASTFTETTVSVIPTETAAPKKLPELSRWEYITFGKYFPVGYSDENNDSEINWQIIDFDTEKGIYKLISSEIIDIKPFDCAESGIYDKDFDNNFFDRDTTYTQEQMKAFRGSNDWESSDLYAWLNATANPSYHGMMPSDRATDESGNSFKSQLGFLSSFSKKELELISKTESGELVSLLSVDEVMKYSEASEFILHPSVTKSAINSDATSWYATYSAYGYTDYIWATKTPYEGTAHQILAVDCAEAHELFTSLNAASSGLGIRPVICIRPEAIDGIEISGSGSKADPYRITY